MNSSNNLPLQNLSHANRPFGFYSADMDGLHFIRDHIAAQWAEWRAS